MTAVRVKHYRRGLSEKKTAGVHLKAAMANSKGDEDVCWQKYDIKPTPNGAVMIRHTSGQSGIVSSGTKISRGGTQGWSVGKLFG